MRHPSGATRAISSGRLKYPGVAFPRRRSGATASSSRQQFQPAKLRRLPPAAEPAQGGQRRGGPGGGAGALVEHHFECFRSIARPGRSSGKKQLQIATPHEGYHRAYGSFASNSPVTDGKYVYASFGSRGIYAYDFNGKLIWEKDLGVQMKMRLAFGEGTGAAAFRRSSIYRVRSRG